MLILRAQLQISQITDRLPHSARYRARKLISLVMRAHGYFVWFQFSGDYYSIMKAPGRVNDKKLTERGTYKYLPRYADCRKSNEACSLRKYQYKSMS